MAKHRARSRRKPRKTRRSLGKKKRASAYVLDWRKRNRRVFDVRRVAKQLVASVERDRKKLFDSDKRGRLEQYFRELLGEAAPELVSGVVHLTGDGKTLAEGILTFMRADVLASADLMGCSIPKDNARFYGNIFPMNSGLSAAQVTYILNMPASIRPVHISAFWLGTQLMLQTLQDIFQRQRWNGVCPVEVFSLPAWASEGDHPMLLFNACSIKNHSPEKHVTIDPKDPRPPVLLQGFPNYRPEYGRRQPSGSDLASGQLKGVADRYAGRELHCLARAPITSAFDVLFNTQAPPVGKVRLVTDGEWSILAYVVLDPPLAPILDPAGQLAPSSFQVTVLTLDCGDTLSKAHDRKLAVVRGTSPIALSTESRFVEFLRKCALLAFVDNQWDHNALYPVIVGSLPPKVQQSVETLVHDPRLLYFIRPYQAKDNMCRRIFAWDGSAITDVTDSRVDVLERLMERASGGNAQE